jgi:hypothetical protein
MRINPEMRWSTASVVMFQGAYRHVPQHADIAPSDTRRDPWMASAIASRSAVTAPSQTGR